MPTDFAATDRQMAATLPCVLRVSGAATIGRGVWRCNVVVLVDGAFRRMPTPTEGGVTGGH